MLLAPTLNTIILDNHVLWFKPSNKYIVINSDLNELITIFLNTNSCTNFKNKVLKKLDYCEDEISQIYKDINNLLIDCNIPKEKPITKDVVLNKSYRKISHYYKVNKIVFEIHFDSEKLKNIIHAQLEHLVIKKPEHPVSFTFDIYHEDQQLIFFKNESFINVYSVNDFHILQGKFAMELLCAINQNEEFDWLGTFHASTVQKNNNTIMLIGDSGSGKSTFTALLMANGFDLVADDITSILAKDKKVYGYPAGVSIKSGAFDTLNSILPDFKKLKEVYINPYKGYVKYIPSNNTKKLTKGYNCNTLVYVNFISGSDTMLEDFDLNKALQILIPESWLEPSENNAKQFMEWLKDLKCYKLTYSNYIEAINKANELV